MSSHESRSMNKPEPEGLGGWLAFHIVLLFLAPLALLATIFLVFLPVLAPSVWQIYQNAGLNLGGMTPENIFSLVVGTAELIYAVVLLVLVFKKARVVPLLFVIYFSIEAFVTLISGAAYGSNFLSVIVGLGWSAIWIPYFLRSRRVRNTFGRQAPVAAPPSDSPQLQSSQDPDNPYATSSFAAKPEERS